MPVVTLSHDDELLLKGDNVSLGYVENNAMAKDVLKEVLKNEEEENDTSYNFGRGREEMEGLRNSQFYIK